MRIFRLLWVILLLLAAAIAVTAQTRVDLRTQSRNVDFSTATTTRPIRTGTVLPTTCTAGEMFFKTDAIPGQNLEMCTSTNTWTAILGTGGTASAATTTAELLDFKVQLYNATTLGIGMTCSPDLPCMIRFGNKSSSIIAPSTVTLSGTGTGSAWIFISPQGTLTVGHNLGTVACSGGCVAQSGVTAFPADAIPVAVWTATSGAWDTNGGIDFRGYLSTKNVAVGAGLLSTEVNGLTTVSADATLIGLRVGVPATAATACTQGTWAIDSNFYYICIATNSWKRAALSVW